LKAEEFLEHVKRAKSRNTWKEYRIGLKKFSEWYGKDLDAILLERKGDLESGDSVRRLRFERKLEEFHRARSAAKIAIIARPSRIDFRISALFIARLPLWCHYTTSRPRT